MKKKVAIVGTNGIPAKYGGYETLVEYLTKNLSSSYNFTVFCSRDQRPKINQHNNAKLIYIPLRANGWQSIIYDITTLFYAIFISDVILYLGPGAGYFVPLIKHFKRNIIINHGGLNEWKREKYSSFQKFIAKMGHKYGAKSALSNIADNELLKQSILSEFGVDSYVIRYGGDHAIKPELTENLKQKYPFLEEEYFVNVSRAQVDNNLHIVLSAFSKMPDKKLVMVSNWKISEYGTKLKEAYKDTFKNLILLDAVYDSAEINSIRAYAKGYIHSHSYCGTSPSLVEAMSLKLPIISFDVPTNRETTQNKALFFEDENDLIAKLQNIKNEELNKLSNIMFQIAQENYTWEHICKQYIYLFEK